MDGPLDTAGLGRYSIVEREKTVITVRRASRTAVMVVMMLTRYTRRDGLDGAPEHAWWMMPRGFISRLMKLGAHNSFFRTVSRALGWAGKVGVKKLSMLCARQSAAGEGRRESTGPQAAQVCISARASYASWGARVRFG